MKKLPIIYHTLMRHILSRGHSQTNMRTNTITRTLPYPTHILLDLSEGYLPVPGNRTIYPKVAAAELAWQLQGTKDPDFIMKHAPKVWGKFIEDGVIENAYGYRWMQHFGRNQISDAISLLKADSSSRQAHISIWDSLFDGSDKPEYCHKNVPCITDLTINIIDNKLNIAVNMRSSDVYVGLPYDLLTYALLLDAFATSLKCDRGYLSFHLANAHIYGPQLASADKETNQLVKTWQENVQEIKMPGLTIEQIIADPEAYVNYFKAIKITNFNGTLPEVVA